MFRDLEALADSPALRGVRPTLRGNKGGKVMKCIGFGEFEGKCLNEAGTKWSPYWCERCNALRFEHIDKRFAKLGKRFDELKAFGKGERAGLSE